MPRSTALAVMALMVLLTAFALSIGFPPPKSAAQSTTPVSVPTFAATTSATVDFPRGVLLSGMLDLSNLTPDPSAPIDLLYRIGRDETLHLVTTSTRPLPGGGPTRVEVTIDLQTDFVPAGVELSVFWRVRLADGASAESTATRALWFDDRWEWRTLTSSQVVVRYVDIDEAFARSILDSAQSTVTDLERRFSLRRSESIALWIYSSAETFRGAQQANSREAVAGASYPGFQLVTAIIPNGDARELGRVIPHEISHQILFQATRNPFTLPPLWFDEGLATHYQVGGTDGFLAMVTRAARQRELFDLVSLDASFPYLSDKATLAYATSWSAIAYIRDVHGDAAIAAMISAFATGASYPVAIEQALGMSRDELDREWRDWISRQAPAAVLTQAA